MKLPPGPLLFVYAGDAIEAALRRRAAPPLALLRLDPDPGFAAVYGGAYVGHGGAFNPQAAGGLELGGGDAGGGGHAGPCLCVPSAACYNEGPRLLETTSY